jgi:uncharacterized protein (DUF433 family)
MPEPVQQLAAALHVLEGHRDPCIRGERAPTHAIVEECDGAMRQANAVYEALLERSAA